MDIPRVRLEYMDADYLAELKKTDPKAYNFYIKFEKEYYGANIKFNKKKIKSKKGKKKKVKNIVSRSNIHKTKKLVKEIFDNNNKRNNDLYGVTKINGLLSDVNSLGQELVEKFQPVINDSIEDSIIKCIDFANNKESNEDKED